MSQSHSSRAARAFAALRGRAGALRLQHFVTPAFALGICALLLVVFQHLSRTVDYHSVISQLWTLNPAQWAGALAATVVSFVALVGRDAVGLRYLGMHVSRGALWAGAIAGSALGNVTGFGALTGGAVRCRVYGGAGVTAAQIGRMSVFTGITLAFALVLMTALGMVGAAGTVSGLLPLSPDALRLAGGTLLGCGAVLVALCPANARAIEPFGRAWLRFSVPARRDLVAQLLLAALDVVGAGLALWSVMPHGHIGFTDFLTVYCAAMLLGLIGHTPGGIGVFEAAMVYALGPSVPASKVLAALLAYRAIYFGAPLALAAAVLAVFEGRALKTPLGARFAKRGADGVSQLAPLFLAIVTFVTGSMLVISGATPAFSKRIALLQTFLPLWVLESSQLMGSLFGVLLLFVARGLLRRLDAAWWLAFVIALANLALSFAKGLAFVEAGVLCVLIVLLLATRKRFNRHSSLFAERFTPAWLASVGCVIALAVWVLLFAFRDVQYSQSLWWQFAFHSRAPRALRATLGAGVFAAALASWQLLRPAAGRFVMPASEDLEAAARIVRAQERSDAGLALMGDKSFLFSASRKAFLMYAKRGRTWAALHDPVGPRDEWPALIREFVTLAHAHGGRAAFYQVRADALPLYLDAGLTLMKLGEEARVMLQEFDLKGPQRAHLRYALKRGERDGFSIEHIEPAQMGASLPVLRAISDAWLEDREAREKSFSVAAFDDDYLAAQSVLLIRQNGEPLAFVTFMTTDLNTDATVGVMRHLPGASPYAMEYLFTQLALHLKAAGYQSLSLGMAPLAGMGPSPLASPWHRLAGFIWRFGGRFYNFRGLRGFKNKFAPRWEPRYLAASGSISVFITLADLSLLAGGWRS
ncbi:bifunctional lysylphosphatidylglycerol flippase/synthetase MprF [Paraburkholderia lycopersici]|uniref:Phosphatidylglycerol lysyltransferase n=1 Tax=Paraburkholderia lycopersici TaxID=416944 RepID=A0A1G6J272_9BURK|nr:bifunctional lysylphosphatidylglycerol flippase/synthetase MprF [Paraburkholderia lycopersici]SDC12942.1 phosphatidylglycerol lysyltransferase [Paraburkholderia lycopersici]